MPPLVPSLLRPLLWLVATIAVALAAPAAAGAAGIQIASDGDAPGIAVDAAGTGHIAFASAVEPTPGNFTYDYSYCRLPRGATACAPRTRLTTPGNETPFGRTRVLVDATRVIVLGDICCGATEGIWAWTSTNGGTTFGAPKKLATDMWVADAIIGPGDNAVSIVDYVSTGGIQWATGSLVNGSPVTNPIRLGADIDNGADVDSYADLGLLNETTPYMVMHSGSKVWLRLFDSTKNDPNSLASWGAPQVIETNGTEPGAAYGPSGAFLGYETLTYDQGGYPYAVRRLADDGTLGPIMKIGAVGASPNDADMTQDTSGRLFVAYQDNHDDNRLKYQWSKRGVTWSDPIVLSDPGEDAGRNTQVGLAPDGGGWVVADMANTRTPVKVWPISPKGDEDPAPAPPPGASPTPVPLACPAQIAVSTLVKAQVRTSDCFKDLGKGRYSTTGSVRVNGIDFVAPASGTFTVDTKAHTVEAKGAYKVQAGSIVLQQGSRTWNVTQVQQIDDLSAFGVKLLGLGVKGKADVTFTAAGADLGVNVELPSPIDGVRGRSVLKTTMAGGLKVTDLHITADTVPLGPIEIRNLDIAYTGANDGFEGKAEIYLPPAAGKAITMGFGLENGAFKHAEFEVAPPLPPLPLPLWATPPVTLNRVGLAARNDAKGFTLSGGLELIAGKEIAGFRPIAIDALPSSGGGASLFIPKKGDYAVISASGKIVILDIPVAYGGIKLSTAGPLTFKGGANIDFEIVDIDVSIEGGINLSNADFYAGGKGKTCVSILIGTGCASVSAIVSSIGFAACGSFEGKENLTGVSVSVSLGFDRKWGGGGNLGSCKYDEYKPASLAASGASARRLARAGRAARFAQLGGAQTVALPGGSDRGVRVKGAGGKPGFTFAGPGGRTITVPSGLSTAVAGGNVVAIPVGPDEVELQVKNPGGSWTLTPTEGPAVAAVETAKALPTPKTPGSVRKLAGRSRELTVRTSNLGDQRLIVREVLPDGGAHELGTVRANGTSKLRFTPTDGPAGKRTIEAVVIAGDRQVGTTPVTTFTAPGPAKLAAPRSVSLKRAKSSLTVRWSKVTGATRYRVLVTSTDGRKQILTAPSSARKLTVPEVTGDDKVTIRVSAVSKVGIEGKGKAATSKAAKKTPKKSTTKKKSTKKK
ncbi:MAG: hypothetical protein J7513_10585 [Solirubrobacteraceae bacterium]|nr:hypothetical protein [Solirubrobacteraceae bacterium]